MSSNQSHSRIYVLPLLLLLLLAAAIGYWKSAQDRLPDGIYMSNGRLEATEVHIASKYPGRLAQVLVREGDQVRQGQLLAVMDSRTLAAQHSQAEAEVMRATENLAVLEANVQLRRSELRLAEQEHRRFNELYERGHASGQQLDQQQTKLDTAAAALEASLSQVSAARAAIGAAQAQALQLSSELDEAELRAPINGKVQLRLAEPGEILAAGGRVLLLIDPSDQYMNLYYPSAIAGLLQQGDSAQVLLDALPDQPLLAKVAFIADKAQFTPKEVETRDERQKLVFRVKLALEPNQNIGSAKPGMPGAGFVRRSSAINWPDFLQQP